MSRGITQELVLAVQQNPATSGFGEHERMILVEDYHRRHRIRMPSVEGHAVAHTIVETQLALGEPVSSLHVLAYALKASIVTTPFTPSARAWQAKQRRRVTLACRWRLQIPPVM